MNSKEVLFPHETIRAGQEPFIRVIRTALEHKKNVLAHVPTGLGKTAAALSPCLKYALDNDKTVVFLTPRHTQHRIAVETLKHIRTRHNLKFHVADFIGKKGMCARDDIDFLNGFDFVEYCRELRSKKECEFYENYFDRSKYFKVKGFITEIEKIPLHVEDITEKSKVAGFCPFEVSADLGKKSHVIIADYLHFLNPKTRENFLNRIEKNLQNCIIIWDEAHNLPDKSREIMSSNVNTFVLDNAIKEAEQFNKDLVESLTWLRERLFSLSHEMGLKDNEKLLDKNNLTEEIELSENFLQVMYDTADIVIDRRKRSYLKTVAGFLEDWMKSDVGYTKLLKRNFSKTGKPVIAAENKCLDSSFVISELSTLAHCNIFMSGTLHPLDMYENLLGLELPIKVEFPNPFPEENRLDLIIPKTTTKYTKRNENMFHEIAKNCNEIANNVPGNVISFFPSYDIRDYVHENLKEISSKKILMEMPNMNKEEKNAILKEFVSNKEIGAHLLAISGGSFGEGISLKGDNLKGVIIVGVPLGKNDLETQELIKYYEQKLGNGTDYGYMMPAFIKVLQNAGRCIRSEKDVGAIVYLDERYLWPSYKKYFPKSVKAIHSFDVDTVKRFFDNVEKRN